MKEFVVDSSSRALTFLALVTGADNMSVNSGRTANDHS